MRSQAIDDADLIALAPHQVDQVRRGGDPFLLVELGLDVVEELLPAHPTDSTRLHTGCRPESDFFPDWLDSSAGLERH